MRCWWQARGKEGHFAAEKHGDLAEKYQAEARAEAGLHLSMYDADFGNDDECARPHPSPPRQPSPSPPRPLGGGLFSWRTPLLHAPRACLGSVSLHTLSSSLRFFRRYMCSLNLSLAQLVQLSGLAAAGKSSTHWYKLTNASRSDAEKKARELAEPRLHGE